MKKLIGVIIALVLLLFIAFQPRIKEQQKYTIVFYSNGGSAIDTITVMSNSTAYEPKSPVRASSEFIGWYTSPDFEDNAYFDFDTKITKSITLYAKWLSQQYLISYELEDGFWPTEEVENKYAKVLDVESNIVYFKFGSKDSPTHPGGTTNAFQGWRTIPQEEYNQLSADEKKNYPYIERIRPKVDNLDELFGENSELVLYAQYRNK